MAAYGHAGADSASTRSFPKPPTVLHRGDTISLKSSVSSIGRDMLPRALDAQRNTHVMTTTMKSSPRRPRKPRKLYPMDYDRRMRDMEHWDHLFFRRGSGRHTWTPPESIPPQPTILDVGCGYGTWAIMAAQELTDCRIVGFDAADIQPNLKRAGLGNIADRITWIHGNMLEPLPFPDCHFDLVRANFIEYCVPENKWADLFQEIDRILKPGGAFETVQEGLILPCPRFAPRPPPVVQHSRTSGGSMKTLASDELANADPRDHSKLKVAFNAMLEVRFLNPQITTVIPFFMNLHFTNVLMTPTLRVMLPPSSFVRSQEDIPDGNAAEPQPDHLGGIRSVLQLEQNTTSVEVEIIQGGQMHLTHTMNNILACREAIWEQFEVLNPDLGRLDFDSLMKNWELDMRDRIDMRETLKAGLRWKEPADSDREDGCRKSWRESMVLLHEGEGLWDAQPLPEVCRAVRAFTGIKPR